jgi:hypothetical protein
MLAACQRLDSKPAIPLIVFMCLMNAVHSLKITRPLLEKRILLCRGRKIRSGSGPVDNPQQQTRALRGFFQSDELLPPRPAPSGTRLLKKTPHLAMGRCDGRNGVALMPATAAICGIRR